MPNYIKLYDASGQINQFDVPRQIVGSLGGTFTIKFVRKGGGNGVVFEAIRDSARFSPPCAIKILKRQDAVRVDRFHNEVRIQSALNHPRIATVFDHGSLDMAGHSIPWAAMDLGDDNLRQHVEMNGPLPRDRLLETATDICDALAHIHSKGIIHRDIKPDNFVWSRRDQRAVMIDFGIAKYVGEDVTQRPLDQFTLNLEFVGPVFYSSPELIEYSRNKKHPVDCRSDLFQAAMVIWFLATNRIVSGIPSPRPCPFGGELHKIISTCLNEDPSDRPSSAGDLGAMLAKLR